MSVVNSLRDCHNVGVYGFKQVRSASMVAGVTQRRTHARCAAKLTGKKFGL
jgi:hypothetical protein